MGTDGIAGETAEVAQAELEKLQARYNGIAHSGMVRFEYNQGQEGARVGAIHCDDDGQPLSQIDLAREVALVNQDLHSFGDGWATQIEVVEADLESVTRQCIEENYPAAREGLER